MKTASNAQQRLQGLWADAWWVLLIFATSRVIIVTIMLFSRQIVARGTFTRISGQMEHGGTLLDLLTQWDGVWYRMIAEHGYAAPAPPLAPAFFPFYPLLIRLAALVFRNFQVASLLVSNACLIVAALLLYRLLRTDYDDLICRRAITFLMFNPVSFFLSGAYTESTFLMLSIGALFAARQRKWLISCLCGMCLSATRPPGLLIAAPLLMEHFLQWRKSGAAIGTLFHPRVLLFALLPLGLAAYMVFCYAARSDFFAPMHAHAAGWKQVLSLPWVTITSPQNFSPSHVPLYQTLVVSGVVLLVVAILSRMRLSYSTYAAVSVLFDLAWTSLEGVPRYFSVIFPFYIALAILAQRWPCTYEPLLAFSVALLSLCTVLFANAYQMT